MQDTIFTGLILFLLGFWAGKLHSCRPAKSREQKGRIPTPGERWRSVDDVRGPWPQPSTEAEILDVRDGWVRYALGSPFRDNRHRIDTFVRLYEPPQ